ncbi:hypothetical protein MUJ63_10360 [Lachnospiraceae bacterium NSJ-143]|nr:hypothetical protein [Lachnospiraceae bacterium NSJ-143]
MDLFNDKRTITANEINKFCYCPYQWYYERLYGRKELSRLAAERNAELGLTDKRLSNFNSGLEYHSGIRFRRGLGIGAAIVLVVFILFVLFVLKVKNFV